MARFVFRLQGYLKVKEKLEEQKKLEYGKAVQRLEGEKEKKRRLVNEMNDSIEDLRTKMSVSVSPEHFIRSKQYITHLEKQIIKQDEVIKRAANFAESKRIELVAAMKQRKMVETLREHEYEEYLSEENKAEQKSIDEIVSYRYGISED